MKLTNEEYGNQRIAESGYSFLALTRREHFAIQILTGLCVPCIAGYHNSPSYTVKELPPHAVMLADALINELNKGENNGK